MSILRVKVRKARQRNPALAVMDDKCRRAMSRYSDTLLPF